MKRDLIVVAMAVGNTWKNQLRLILAEIQMQSSMHMQKTGDVNTCRKTALLSFQTLEFEKNKSLALLYV